MKKLIIAITTTLNLCVNAAYYNCTFGPDALGNYMNDIVDKSTVDTCGEFCSCVGLTNNTCHWGPDSQGNFITRLEVPSELADKCDRAFCVCDNHYFDPESEQTFDSILEERLDAAIDWTVKDHGDNIAREAKPVYIDTPAEQDEDGSCGFACAGKAPS